MSGEEFQLSNKPWITQEIFHSIKAKNKLFKDILKVLIIKLTNFFKKYLNKLTHVKNLAKHCYYNRLINENKTDSSKFWSVIKAIINYENTS